MYILDFINYLLWVKIESIIRISTTCVLLEKYILIGLISRHQNLR